MKFRKNVPTDRNDQPGWYISETTHVWSRDTRGTGCLMKASRLPERIFLRAAGLSERKTFYQKNAKSADDSAQNQDAIPR